MQKVNRRAVISLPMALALPCAGAAAVIKSEIAAPRCTLDQCAGDGWGVFQEAGVWKAYAISKGRELSLVIPEGPVEDFELARGLYKLLLDAGPDPIEQLGVFYGGAHATLYCQVQNLTCDPLAPRGLWLPWALQVGNFDMPRPRGIAWVGAPLI